MKIIGNVFLVLLYLSLEYMIRENLGFGSVNYWLLSIPNFLLLIMLLKLNSKKYLLKQEK
ncbi:TPA: hypothetical protein ACGOWN_001715 [Streptococcus suis]